ncbi:hypothetical protein CLOM_g21142 [Closterium sp. NIES-68]|nr:hypothetical protein CLOM_g21142 [Closterium sp. NIES-68]GJP77214.1 hypothetical protein CLOP_g7639 [Closterium sp. NIES-67]GJP81750.1 hypothetical protein CLOP_g11884 [Closterium sp. NIES-67]
MPMRNAVSRISLRVGFVDWAGIAGNADGAMKNDAGRRKLPSSGSLDSSGQFEARQTMQTAPVSCAMKRPIRSCSFPGSNSNSHLFRDGASAQCDTGDDGWGSGESAGTTIKSYSPRKGSLRSPDRNSRFKEGRRVSFSRRVLVITV